MDLAEIRKKINMIDFEILKLLNRRMEFALRTKQLKSSVTDPRREGEVIEYIQTHSQGLIQPDFCKRLFMDIISESKRLQSEEVCLIGFQGEHGSFSEVAARIFNNNLIYISCSEFREIFNAVERGLLQYGIVPVESTLGGTVTDVNQLMVSSDIRIIGEIKIPIHYCLLTLPETDPHEVRVVYSHRQVLSQCQKFLFEHRLEARPYYDAAGAAKMLLQERPEGTAAIASRFAADFYNLDVLTEGVEDFPNNMTRFLVISHGPLPEEGNKCTIIFSTEHKAGALFETLRDFADSEINLSRIESMPNAEDPGNYVFFLDFHGSPHEERVAAVLDSVQKRSSKYKFLGCYKADQGEATSQ